MGWIEPWYEAMLKWSEARREERKKREAGELPPLPKKESEWQDPPTSPFKA